MPGSVGLPIRTRPCHPVGVAGHQGWDFFGLHEAPAHFPPDRAWNLFLRKCLLNHDTVARVWFRVTRTKGKSDRRVWGSEKTPAQEFLFSLLPHYTDRHVVGDAVPPVSFTVTNASRNWCKTASNSSLSSGVRLPSVFSWSMASRSIECLACSRCTSTLFVTGLGISPSAIAPCRYKVLTRKVRLAGGSGAWAPAGDGLGRLGRLGGVTGRLPLGLHLALPVFVHEEFLLGMLRFIRHWYTSQTPVTNGLNGESTVTARRASTPAKHRKHGHYNGDQTLLVFSPLSSLLSPLSSFFSPFSSWTRWPRATWRRNAAATKPANSGCGFVGCDLNSG